MEDKALKAILEKGFLAEAPNDLKSRILLSLSAKNRISIKFEPLVTRKHWIRFMLAIFGVAALSFGVSFIYPNQVLSTEWTDSLTAFSQSQIAQWISALILTLWAVVVLDSWLKPKLNQRSF